MQFWLCWQFWDTLLAQNELKYEKVCGREQIRIFRTNLTEVVISWNNFLRAPSFFGQRNVISFRCCKISIRKCIFTRTRRDISNWKSHWVFFWPNLKINTIWAKKSVMFMLKIELIKPVLQPQNRVTFVYLRNNDISVFTPWTVTIVHGTDWHWMRKALHYITI